MFVSDNGRASTFDAAKVRLLVIDAGAGADDIDLRPFAATGQRDCAVRAAIGGGAGDDRITGGAAADTIGAGDGNDLLVDSAVPNFLSGGLGSDTLIGTDDVGNFGDKLDAAPSPAGVDGVDKVYGSRGIDVIRLHDGVLDYYTPGGQRPDAIDPDDDDALNALRATAALLDAVSGAGA